MPLSIAWRAPAGRIPPESRAHDASLHETSRTSLIKLCSYIQPVSRGLPPTSHRRKKSCATPKRRKRPLPTTRDIYTIEVYSTFWRKRFMDDGAPYPKMLIFGISFLLAVPGTRYVCIISGIPRPWVCSPGCTFSLLKISS